MEQQHVAQKLSTPLIIVLIAVLSSAGPISTDIFMPAVPSMPEILNTTEPMVNMGITVFFFTQAIGMLVFGPISDRFGRKVPLLISLTLFCLCSFFTSFTNSIYFMLTMRGIQGFGGGGNVAIATAIVKDCFEGEQRKKVLVVSQALTMIAPVIAPIIGSVILTFADWRVTFIAQTVLGLLCVPLVIALREPLVKSDRTTGNPLFALGGLITVAKNPLFVVALIATSTGFIGGMAYVTSASYVYIDFFGTSTFVYSLFFGGSSGITVLVVLFAVRLSKFFGTHNTITYSLIVITAFSLVMLLFGECAPWVYFLCIVFILSLGNIIRPLSINILLGLQEHDTGSASALIQFAGSILGCIGSAAISLPWPTYIMGVAVLDLVSMGGSLIIWLRIHKKLPDE